MPYYIGNPWEEKYPPYYIGNQLEEGLCYHWWSVGRISPLLLIINRSNTPSHIGGQWKECYLVY